MMGGTCRAGTADPSLAHVFTPCFSGVRVSRSFEDRCLFFCRFSFWFIHARLVQENKVWLYLIHNLYR
jgi:hypothetical protein